MDRRLALRQSQLLACVQRYLRRMGLLVILYALYAGAIGVCAILEQTGMDIVGWTIVAAVVLGLVVGAKAIRVAAKLEEHFQRNYSRARLLCILLAIVFCPLLTIPALVAFRHLGQIRDEGSGGKMPTQA